MNYCIKIFILEQVDLFSFLLVTKKTPIFIYFFLGFFKFLLLLGQYCKDRMGTCLVEFFQYDVYTSSYTY